MNGRQLGLLLGAFSWTYALSQLLGFAGWLVDRFHVSWILGGRFFSVVGGDGHHRAGFDVRAALCDATTAGPR
ncbi:MAG: hypothetical protein WDO73_33815 [Ignavibacteriota bacterium]